MKNQFLFLSLVTALLAGCVKNEIDGPGNEAPRTHISAKAQGAGDIPLDTKAPVTGTSLNGKTADVYTSSENLDNPADRTKMFSDAYARGTMTFDDNNYVAYNKTDFGGLNGGKSVLPTDGSVLHMYGFYPAGWARTASATYENLAFTFDGSHDVMSTWLTAADDMQVKYNDVANVPDKADFTFKHLLTRYNIQIKANDADAVTAWGGVMSVKIEETAVTNRVTFNKKDGASLGVGYDNDGTTLTPVSFFKLTGTDLAKPTYSDDKFATADYASAFVLTQSYQNACYSMVAPVTVDATAAAELTLVVNTILADGKEILAEVPVMLDQTKFTAPYSTRGYSITLALNFRVGAIEAIATVEPWKDGGEQNEPVKPPVPPSEIGKVKDGGVVYWVDPADPNTYKVVALAEGPSLIWAAKDTYEIGSGAQSETDAKGNAKAIKAYYDTNPGGIITESTFEAAFPAAAYCYNYQGKDGADAKGSWYLPAKFDLQYLWCAYNGHAPVSWGNGINTSVPADPAAQAVFNKYLTDAGGDVMLTNGGLFSSTEYRSRPRAIWAVLFLNGYTDNGSKDSPGVYMRCIKNVEPQPSIGDLKNGGIVYWVDAADATNYKVVSVEQWSGKTWAASNGYAIGSGAQSATDGKGNAAAIKAYFEANKGGTVTQSTFEEAFPAAAECYNYQGKDGTDAKGSWYLPAKNELQYLWCAYNGKAPISWGSVPAASPDATAQAVFNKYLTNAGGDAFPTSGDNFWSSTEDSDGYTSRPLYVYFSNGRTNSVDMNTGFYVRCVLAN